MTTDLDDLLRATFDGRAASVSSGPDWAGAPARRPRTPWIAAAAAAVTVLGLAGGLAYLARSGAHDDHAGGGIPNACQTTLPPAWQSALTATPFKAGGHLVYPDVITAAGAVLGSWTDDSKALRTIFVEPDGQTRDLPAGDLATTMDTDGVHAVFGSAPGRHGNAELVDDIAVVDIATGATRHILARAPTPKGWVPATYLHSAVIQDGVVYWSMRPPGPDNRVTRTDVVSFTIATRKYAIVDHLTGDFSYRGTDEVDRDVRGVGWTGGSVPAMHAPMGLPAFRTADGQYQPVSSDGRSAAWSLPAGSSTVHWSDGAGDVREFDVPQRHDPDNALAVSGVSGPFVFFWFNSNIGGEMVLDTRTGAFARTGLAAGTTVLAAGDRVLLSDFGASLSTVVDPSDLPELTC